MPWIEFQEWAEEARQAHKAGSRQRRGGQRLTDNQPSNHRSIVYETTVPQDTRRKVKELAQSLEHRAMDMHLAMSLKTELCEERKNLLNCVYLSSSQVHFSCEPVHTHCLTGWGLPLGSPWLVDMLYHVSCMSSESLLAPSSPELLCAGKKGRIAGLPMRVQNAVARGVAVPTPAASTSLPPFHDALSLERDKSDSSPRPD